MRVGIVGAGISGVVAGAHLEKADIEYFVFERSSKPGGVWLYDERTSLDPVYPAMKASREDVDDVLGLENSAIEAGWETGHAPPGPCYDGLKNNVSTRLMKTTLNPWPPDTVDFVNHRVLSEYIRDTSIKARVDEKTLYNIKVEKIEKNGSKWDMRTSMLTADNKVSEQLWSFDAIVVASGHYHARRIPDISGLAEWKRKWPTRVQHSKSYRRPGSFEGQNVLLIGAGVSSTDIARELGPVADNIYQTSRNGTFDLPPKLLPENGLRVDDIESFETPLPTTPDHLREDPSAPFPLSIRLRDKTALTDIHRIILCTGYHISLPFLSHLHSDTTPPSQASDTVLVTDGTQRHNLHKDIFYIPDPTLTFIGVPYFTATFTLFEFQAMALAAVLSGKAELPTQEEMKAEYRARLERKGCGKGFHSLRGEEIQYVKSLVEWINRDAERKGVQGVEGHTAAWHEANEDRIKMMRERLGENYMEIGFDKQELEG